MDCRKLAREIVDQVGGKENITSVTHCFTRLRLVLRDRKLADKEKVSRLEGVISVVDGGGQFQVVIGNKVEQVYDEVTKLVDVENSAPDGEKKSAANAVFQVISAMFTPLVPAIAASGLLKGILTAAQLYMNSKGVDITGSDTYVVLYAASQIIFYYMPIFLACTAAKALKTSQFTAMVLGGLLVYPQIDALMQDAGTVTRVLGIPMVKGAWQIGDAEKVFSYTESVIPIILVVIVLKYLEKFLKKVIPEVLQVILVPGLSLIVMVPVTFGVLGPIGIYIGNAIQVAYNAIIGFNVILGGALIGGLWCVFVAFGAHRALVPVSINDVAVSGSQTLMAMSSPANFAQGGAALGVMLRTKNRQLKSVAASTSLTAALAGITEPALYGCNLRLKKPMICAVISGAVGGALIGWGGVYAESHVNGCLLTSVAYAAGGMDKFLIYLLGCGIAFFGAAILTFIVGFEDDPTEPEGSARKLVMPEATAETADICEEEVPEKVDIRVTSPVKGKLIPLSQVKDEVFAACALGRGAAVIPEKGEVVAPEDCEVSVLYDTGHAIGLKLKSGVELLIHIGIDTVELGGRFFAKEVSQGAKLTRGDKIVSFDIEGIRQAGYDPTVCVIVTNTEEYKAVAKAPRNRAEEGADAILIETGKGE